jgi:putative FmdB family regulatory protein
MPTYEYVCKNCGYSLEELQSMSEPPLTKCPRCGQDTLARVMGTGGALIFKGSGFYQTDYRKSSAPGSTSPPTKEKKSEDAAAPPSTPPPKVKPKEE